MGDYSRLRIDRSDCDPWSSMAAFLSRLLLSSHPTAPEKDDREEKGPENLCSFVYIGNYLKDEKTVCTVASLFYQGGGE